MARLQGRTDLAGKTLAITGQNVPSGATGQDRGRGRRGMGPGEEPTHGNHACPACGPKLDQFAQQNQMQVTYQRSQDNGNGLQLNADYRDPANPNSNLQSYLADAQASRDGAARRGR